MSETLTTLIERFSPTHERNVASVMRVQKDGARHSLRAFEAAWTPHAVMEWSVTSPFEPTDKSSLLPIAWVTENQQLLVPKINYATCKDSKLLLAITPEQVRVRDRDNLTLGLSGEFERIEAGFQDARKKALSKSIDRAIERVRGTYTDKVDTRVRVLINSLLDPALDNQSYASCRNQIVESLLD